jgi:hypothetical protein
MSRHLLDRSLALVLAAVLFISGCATGGSTGSATDGRAGEPGAIESMKSQERTMDIHEARSQMNDRGK